jgi:hypothetical protein
MYEILIFVTKMELLKKLDKMFESETIKPTFMRVHVLLALLIYEQNRDGIGRYRLKEDLRLGSGTARSLIKRLKKDLHFINVSNVSKNDQKKSKRMGHVLTQEGAIFLTEFKKRIPLFDLGDISIIKDIIIESEGIIPYISLVKNGSPQLKYGVEQRDAAIKVNGEGATCLVYNGANFFFPHINYGVASESEKVASKIENYLERLIKQKNNQLERGDVIIIGLGRDLEVARLASLNAALTLL